MILLLEQLGSQEVKILATDYVASVTYELINQINGDANTSNSILTNNVGGYLVFSDVFAIKDKVKYDFRVMDSTNDEVIYIGQIFCTNSGDNNLNAGEYTENINDNEYTEYNG